MRQLVTTRCACMVLPFALLGLTPGCQPAASKPAPKTASVKKQVTTVAVGVVREQLLKQTIELPVSIESDETAALMARVEAYVGKVLVDIGDEVKAGQVLVDLQAPEIEQRAEEYRAMIQQLKAGEEVLSAELAAARSQLNVVRAQLKLKRSEHDRRASLVSTGALSEQLLEETEADVQSEVATLVKHEHAVKVVEAKLLRAKSEIAVGVAKLNQAETMAGYLEIKAPFAGVVAQRNVDPGNLVRPASQSTDMKPLLVVSKFDEMRAVMHATTDVAGQLAPGLDVTIEVEDSNRILQQHIARVAGVYHQKTRMMRVEIDVDNSPDDVTGKRPLHAGTYGSATITLQSATGPVVPVTALRKRGDRTSVVIVRDGACLATPVKIQFASEGLAAIAAGVAVGDQVVADPESVKDEQVLKDSEIKIVSW